VSLTCTDHGSRGDLKHIRSPGVSAGLDMPKTVARQRPAAGHVEPGLCPGSSGLPPGKPLSITFSRPHAGRRGLGYDALGLGRGWPAGTRCSSGWRRSRLSGSAASTCWEGSAGAGIRRDGVMAVGTIRCACCARRPRTGQPRALQCPDPYCGTGRETDSANLGSPGSTASTAGHHQPAQPLSRVSADRRHAPEGDTAEVETVLPGSEACVTVQQTARRPRVRGHGHVLESRRKAIETASHRSSRHAYPDILYDVVRNISRRLREDIPEGTFLFQAGSPGPASDALSVSSAAKHGQGQAALPPAAHRRACRQGRTCRRREGSGQAQAAHPALCRPLERQPEYCPRCQSTTARPAAAHHSAQPDRPHPAVAFAAALAGRRTGEAAQLAYQESRSARLPRRHCRNPHSCGPKLTAESQRSRDVLNQPALCLVAGMEAQPIALLWLT
jgi:hypothetical protein